MEHDAELRRCKSLFDRTGPWVFTSPLICAIVSTMRKRKIVREEDGVQARFLKELTPLLREDIWVGAIPNGGYRTPMEALALKATGVRPGAADIFFIAPNGVSAWLETKTEKKGSGLSDYQKGFRALCLRNGHLWGMYRNTEEGLAQVRAWGFLKDGR
jgi:hypothetical protein